MKSLTIIILIMMLISCKTWQDYAKESNWIPIEDAYKYQEPRNPLPHPNIPMLPLKYDADKKLIPPTIADLMQHVILYGGTVEKFQYLVEVYEREWCKLSEGYNNEKFKGKSLEDLKKEYLKLVSGSEEKK